MKKHDRMIRHLSAGHKSNNHRIFIFLPLNFPVYRTDLIIKG